MLLKQTAHFQARMSERGIDFEHIKQAIREPNCVTEVCMGKKKVRKILDGGKIIEVIYYKEHFRNKADTYVLITAYYIDHENTL